MKRPPNVHPAIFELSKRFSSVLLVGPPLSEKVIRLVEHLFTPEEAEVAVALPNFFGKPVERIARKLKREPEEVQPYLDSMTDKRIILKVIKDGKPVYALLPLVPGMFEMALMKGADTPWHRRYAQLFEELFATGYVRDIADRKLPGVRNIPLEKVLPSESRVLDTDKFSQLLASHEHFAVINVCQCRQTRNFIDHECKRSKPADGCLLFGSFAQSASAGGTARAVSREEMRDIAIERFEKKLVFLTGNVKFSSPNAICTCCDCCCEFLRSVNEFGAKGLMAPSHFIAFVDESLCNNCGKCAKVCNTHAHTMVGKAHSYDARKCIGCGYCVPSCKEKAITMRENPAYIPPSEDFKKLIIKLLPQATVAAIKTRLTR